MDVVLGLDLGTTNCKALAMGEDGQPVASVSAPTPVHTVTLPNTLQPGEEFDAEELWQTCAQLIRALIAKPGVDFRVVGIAVASFGEAGVLLDDARQPLAPIIAWRDPRTMLWLDWWRTRISETEMYRITGLSFRHIYSVNKLLWYREHAPQMFMRAHTWLCIADWITFRLTAQLATSYALACRTMLFDVSRRAWSDELLRLANLPADLLPPPLPSGQIVGAITADAARETGLLAGTPVVIGGHDHVCAALAAGVTEPGTILDSSGTVEAILVPLDQPILDLAATGGMPCGCHTARERYYLIGGVMSGAVVDWLARVLTGDDAPTTVSQLMLDAARAPIGAEGLWFEPYLDGAGSYLRDPAAWGAWLGLRLHHSRADMIRAAMEGLTFGIRHLLEKMQRAGKFPARALRAVGGGTRNTWWQQLKADVIGAPIETLVVSDVTAQGAALLAGIGIGMYADEATAIARAYRPMTRYAVNAENHARYEALYRDVFEKLYPALKPISLGRDYAGAKQL
ncbi:MAG: carbohydrate kinase [Chloroflexi bacterium]|nr:carbohydrate kinase [Chloroflexota bacterium]